jgi:hypothetical protein
MIYNTCIIFSANIKINTTCAAQFSPSTYILLLYIHRAYIYRIFPGETCAHQCLFFIRPRIFAITFPYTYYHTSIQRICTLGIHFLRFFFFFTIVLIEKCLHIIIIVCVLYVVFLAIYNNIIYKYAFGEKSPSTFVMPHRVVMCVVRVRRGLYYYNIQYENKIYRLVLDAAAYLLVYDIMINLLKFN